MISPQSQSLVTNRSVKANFLQLEGSRGEKIAWRRIEASGAGAAKAGIVWLGGFKSDMHSTKAECIANWAIANERNFVRFDYSGHGESGGRFEDGTIGLWMVQSLAIIRHLTSGPQVLVGSSMGGWIALLAARMLAGEGEASRLAGLVLIAPAVDFTEALIWAKLPQETRREIETKGYWLRDSQYAPEAFRITRRLIEEGRNHLLFGREIRSHCPVSILQGMQDPDVPWQHTLRLVEHLATDPVALTLIRDGDHRLSREADIQHLLKMIAMS